MHSMARVFQIYGCQGSVVGVVVVVGGAKGAFMLHFLVSTVGVCYFPEGLCFLISVLHAVSGCVVLCPVVGGVKIQRVRSDSAAGRGSLRLAVCPLSCSCCCASGFGGYVRQCGV